MHRFIITLAAALAAATASLGRAADKPVDQAAASPAAASASKTALVAPDKPGAGRTGKPDGKADLPDKGKAEKARIYPRPRFDEVSPPDTLGMGDVPPVQPPKQPKLP